MSSTLVEVQETDRFFVFGAPSTSCKVKWPTAAAGIRKESTRAEPRDPPVVLRTAQRAPPNMASEGLVATAVSVGARKVLPEDVLLVAVHGARVDLHPASLEKACPVPCKAPKGGDKTFDVRCGWTCLHTLLGCVCYCCMVYKPVVSSVSHVCTALSCTRFARDGLCVLAFDTGLER